MSSTTASAPRRSPLGSTQTLRARQHVTDGAIGPYDDEFGVDDLFAAQRARQRTIVPRHGRGAVREEHLGGDGVGGARHGADAVFFGNAEELDRGRVELSHPAVDVAGHQAQGQPGDDGREQHLILQQRRGHLLALGDVAQEFDRALRFRAAATHERSGDAHPQLATVLAQIALFRVQVGNLAAPQPFQAALGGLDVVRVGQFQDRLSAEQELVGLEAEQGAERTVAVAQRAVAVGEGNADGGVLDGVAEQRFDWPQGARYSEQARGLGT